MSKYHREQLASLLKKEVSEFLNRNFFYEGALVTLTDVSLSQKSETAKIGVSIMPEAKQSICFSSLIKIQPALQKYLIKKLHLHFIPRVQFILDGGLASSARVAKLLSNE